MVRRGHTPREIAAEACVALQTLVNHFGSKDELFAAAAKHIGTRSPRFARPWNLGISRPPQRPSWTTTTAPATSSSALPASRSAFRGQKRPRRGRRGHQDWVERVFAGALTGLRGVARKRRVAQLVAATDVYTWKLLRRDKELSREQTITAIRELLEALHDHRGGTR